MLELLQRLLVPNVAAAIWIGLLVAFTVFGDTSRLIAPRNIALLVLLGSAVPLADLLRLGKAGSGIAPKLFTVLFLYTALYAVWGFMLARRPLPGGWKPNPSRNGLRALVLAIAVLDIGVLLGRHPDDAGTYTNLGAQRWMETGSLPYADPLLKGDSSPGHGASATYGPLLYAAHVPLQLVIGTRNNPPAAVPRSPEYRWPSILASQLTCLIFHFLGLWALFGVMRRIAGEDMALGAVALYAGSPFVFGLGGEKFLIGGLVYISHIAPTATVLLALLAIGIPALSGALLAAAAGLLFWPVFLFPAWFGWRFWRRDKPWHFAAGFIVTGAAIGALVMAGTHTSSPVEALKLFLSSTLEHQEGATGGGYGASHFSFWGTHPWLASFWTTPLFGTTSLFKPTFLAFATLAAAAFFFAKNRTVAQLAALTGGLAAALQLWHTHGTGTYIEWGYPFLLIGLFGAGREKADG